MKEWSGDTGSSSGDHIMDGDDETVAATASLAVAITALFFAVFMTIFVLILFYFLLRLRGDVKRLHTVVGAQSTVENGSSQLNANRLNHPPDIPTESEPVLDQKPTLPPPTPTTPKVTTPPQSIPQSPPHVFSNTGGEMECVEPVRSTTPRDAYDNVNLLSGILPPELRTAENLEGRPLQLEEVKKLEEMERESYEEIEMSMKRKEEAVAAMREMAGSPGGQGGGQIFEDDYTSPVDALKGKKAAVKETNVGSVKQSKDESKRFMVKSPPFDDEHVPGVYTAVFDQLPSGEKEVVAKQQHKAVGRGASDTSPLIDRKNVEGGEGGGGRVDVCGYEDLSDELFIGARSAPTQDSPLFTSVGNITSSGTQSSPKGDKKVELNKRFSHPPHATRRDATKEMVEVNPRSRKPVTLSSGRRKQLKTDQGEKEGVDGERDSDSLSPTTKNSTSEPITQDSYALVDLTGKHRYRAESDSMKREGSGAPKHYTVKECPPDTDGMPEQTVDS